MKLTARYKKYAFGAKMSATELANGIGGAGAFIGSMADSLGPANTYGKKSMASNLLSGAGNGVAAGAAFGPWGAAIGGAAGLVGGLINNSKQKSIADNLAGQDTRNKAQQEQQYTTARMAADPTSFYGSTGALLQGYYATGGPLNVANQQTKGGTATPLNSGAAEFNGPSHAEGGIQIPGMQAEVEGGETTNGDYVFSKQLGFAKLHKPIATAIGKIESKTLSPERLNSLKLLRDKENQLKLSQEYVRHTLGLK